jgi:hypothetical protein
MKNCNLCPTKHMEELDETLWACDACDEWITKMESSWHLDQERIKIYLECEKALEESEVKSY